MLAAMTSAELYARAVEAMPGGNTRSTLYIPPVPHDTFTDTFA